VVVLFAAAAYEAAVALEWIPMGSQPGEDPPGQAVATTAAFLALVVGMGLGAAAALRMRATPRWPAVLVPAAAVAYLTAHFYAFDPYYLPTLRRFSDQGSVRPAWVLGVAVSALLDALAVGVRPRVGFALMPPVLFVCAVTVVAEGIGH
jgi:hypothetical protein